VPAPQDLDMDATVEYVKDPIKFLKAKRFVYNESLRARVASDMSKLTVWKSLAGNDKIRSSEPKTGDKQEEDVLEITDLKDSGNKSPRNKTTVWTAITKLEAKNEQGKKALMNLTEPAYGIAVETVTFPGVEAHYLPYRQTQLAFTKIPAGSKLKLAMTDPLSGCTIYVTGDAAKPTFAHGNAAMVKGDAKAKQEYMDALLAKAAPGEKILQVLRFKDYEKCQSFCTIAVVGFNEGGKWTFYWTNHKSKTETKLEPLPKG